MAGPDPATQLTAPPIRLGPGSKPGDDDLMSSVRA